MRRAEQRDQLLRQHIIEVDPEFSAFMRMSVTGRLRDESFLAFIKDKAISYQRQHPELTWAILERQLEAILPSLYNLTNVDRSLVRFQRANFDRKNILAISANNAALRGALYAQEDWVCKVYRFFGASTLAVRRQVDNTRRVIPRVL